MYMFIYRVPEVVDFGVTQARAALALHARRQILRERILFDTPLSRAPVRPPEQRGPSIQIGPFINICLSKFHRSVHLCSRMFSW